MEGLNLLTLRAIAKKYNIKGYYKMNKATLFDVLHDMKEEILKEPIGVIDNRCHHRKIK